MLNFKTYRDNEGKIIAAHINGRFYVKPLHHTKTADKLKYYRPVFEAMKTHL